MGALFDVVAGGPGFVAVGEAGARENPIATVWSSPDGHAWSASPLDTAPSSAVALTGGAPGLVAVGTAAGKAAIWTSSDGKAWAKVSAVPDPAGRLVDVAAAGPGFLAAGRSGNGHPAFWLSADGRSWVEIIPSTTLSGTVSAIQQAGSTIHAVVTEDGPPAQDFVNFPRQVWTSTNGSRWTPVREGSLPPMSSVATVATGNDQIMILGLIFPLAGWPSTDGWSTLDGAWWYRAFVTSSANGGATTGTSVGGKLVLAGTLVTTPCCGVPALWTDTGAAGSGGKWVSQVVAFDGDPPGEFQISSVAAAGTTIVAVGQVEFVTADCTGCTREGVVVTSAHRP